MIDYWSNYATTGDPNGGSLPEWPLYDTDARKRIYLDSEISVAPLTAIELERYEYFAGIGMDELSPALNSAR